MVETVGANHAMSGDGDVSKPARHEFFDGELQGRLAFRFAEISISEGDAISVEIHEAGAADRATPKIPSEIDRKAVAVGVGLFDPDVPPLAGALAKRAKCVGEVHSCRQLPFVGAQPGFEAAEQTTPVNLSNHAQRHEEIAPARFPPPVRGDSTGGDQAVCVGMEDESPSPGVKGRDHPWPGAQMRGIGQQAEQDLARDFEKKVAGQLRVPTPKGSKLRGHGEHHVEVLARQQAVALPLEPSLGIPTSTTGARSMAARVVADLLEMSLGANLPVSAHRGGAAGKRRPDGPMMMIGQPSLAGQPRVAGSEHGSDVHSHKENGRGNVVQFCRTSEKS